MISVESRADELRKDIKELNDKNREVRMTRLIARRPSQLLNETRNRSIDGLRRLRSGDNSLQLCEPLSSQKLLQRSPRLPLLGDRNSMYDIVTVIAAKSGSTSGVFRSLRLRQQKRSANVFFRVAKVEWGRVSVSVEGTKSVVEDKFLKGIAKAVAIGSTEAVVDAYVGLCHWICCKCSSVGIFV